MYNDEYNEHWFLRFTKPRCIGAAEEEEGAGEYAATASNHQWGAVLPSAHQCYPVLPSAHQCTASQAWSHPIPDWLDPLRAPYRHHFLVKNTNTDVAKSYGEKYQERF